MANYRFLFYVRFEQLPTISHSFPDMSSQPHYTAQLFSFLICDSLGIFHKLQVLNHFVHIRVVTELQISSIQKCMVKHGGVITPRA